MYLTLLCVLHLCCSHGLREDVTPTTTTAASGRPSGGRGAAGAAGDGRWEVHARIERFVEPALLLLLRDGETHGYDLAEALAELAPDDTVDLGNLYRLLRSLEVEGVVVSRWRDDLPGRAKRTYALTDGRTAPCSTAGRRSLRRAGDTIAGLPGAYQRDNDNDHDKKEGMAE